MASSKTTAADVLAIARAEIGVREGRDPNGNWNNRVKYTTWYANHPLIKNPSFLTSAWCAIFVSWIANKAGCLATLIPMHAWTPSGLAWFKTRGLVTQGKGARPGDVVYFYRPDMGRVAHVGLVEAVDGDYIVTIEGNTNTSGSRQGNGVYRLRRKITNHMYFCHPAYAKPATASTASKPSATAALPKVSLSRLRTAARTNPTRTDRKVTYPAVEVVEKALVKKGRLAKKWADGHYGTTTIAGYAALQRSYGYRGADADGIPGRASLQRLAKDTGLFVVVD